MSEQSFSMVALNAIKKIDEVIKRHSESVALIKEKRRLIKSEVVDLNPEQRRDLYELNLLEANKRKTDATDLMDDVVETLEASKVILKEIEGGVRLGRADDKIRSMGIGKITEGLRDAVIDSDPSLVELRKKIAKLSSIHRSIEKYEWVLKGDEDVYKTMLESYSRRPI